MAAVPRARRRWWALLVAALVGLVAVSFVMIVFSNEDRADRRWVVRGNGNAIGTGESVPRFRLPGMSGGVVDTASLGGKPMVINFWRSDCAPCRKEFPLLNELAHTTDVGVIGVNVRDLAIDARKFVHDQQARWPQAIDARGEVAKTFRVNGLPQTVFVTASGTVGLRVFGELSRRDLQDGLSAIGIRADYRRDD